MYKSLILPFIEDLIRSVSGPAGVRLRRAYYSRRFMRCGKNLVIDPGVRITNPQDIIVGDYVWIDTNCILTAGKIDQSEAKRVKDLTDGAVPLGQICIGDGSHLGIGTIIQGHGGVKIGNRFTSSAGTKIYSFSNDPYRGRGGPISRDGNVVARVETPVLIEDNVWLGINSVVIGAWLGSDAFVKPGSIVTSRILSNSVIEGHPARQTGIRYRETERSVLKDTP